MDDKETGRKPSIRRQTTGYRKERFATEETRFIEDGFTKGFEIGYEGPKDRQQKPGICYLDVKLCMEVGEKTKEGTCYLAKSDLGSAFRHLPIKPEDWKWLVMMARHPKTNEKFYFIEKSLPFGMSISCGHFQRVSDGIEAIFRYQTRHKVNNYLDDFLFVAYCENLCNNLVH